MKVQKKGQNEKVKRKVADFQRLKNFLCDPVGIRTRDPQLRRLLLYPAELPDRPKRTERRELSRISAAKVLNICETYKFSAYKFYLLTWNFVSPSLKNALICLAAAMPALMLASAVCAPIFLGVEK